MKKVNHYTFGSVLILLTFFNSSCSKTDSSLQSSEKLTLLTAPQLSLASVTSKQIYNWHPGHYVLFNDAEEVVTPSSTPTGFLGVQKKYNWNVLEPNKGNYNFSSIQADINGLAAGKYLVIQIQTKAFQLGNTALPDYIKNFNGPGQAYYGRTYVTSTGSINPSYWDALITTRLKALYKALGNRFKTNRKIEMVIVSESALSAKGDDLDNDPATVGPRGEQYQNTAYSDQGFTNGLIEQMDGLAIAFPFHIVSQYTGFPPEINTDLIAHELDQKIGTGANDINPLTQGLNNPTTGVFRFYRDPNQGSLYVPGKIPLAGAIQHKDYTWDEDAATADPTMQDLFNQANGGTYTAPPQFPYPYPAEVTKSLKINHLFWVNRGNGYFTSAQSFVAAKVAAEGLAGGLVAALPLGFSIKP